ncbi:zinc metalloprotease [Nonomuraea pusilla]|uniref:Pregnancy-associated plasma protein-A n=1 Tax=Nonomuraea pusilla TaxID=46177 RepID=A0A1H7WCF6_9ACTN|nr:zinc metalloprotease [Nonomuraea pusilla]SEM19191.1 Pregnancy-associated plasma protein-A [Nonomuraea pusilla]
MARRATAVSLACLLAAGAAPPLATAPAHAHATATCASAPAGAEARGPLARILEARGLEARGPLPRSRRDPETTGPRSPRPEDVARVTAEVRRRLGGAAPPPRVAVRVRAHVITAGQRQVTHQDVVTQIGVLNAAYAGRYGGADTGVRFVLDGVTVRDEPAWFADPVANERAMKTALHQGGADTLNLYIAQLSERMLGFASYPYWYAGEPELDGVVIDWRSLPGGQMTDYNRGFTGVHEIGHWLGLFHTFENGCREPGDGIDDTPPEAKPSEGCPVDKDTCPQQGRDPSRNFMDYANDTCMSEFSAGQALRMREMWAVYRRAPAA